MASAPPQQRAGTRPGPTVGMQRWHSQQLSLAHGRLLTPLPHTSSPSGNTGFCPEFLPTWLSSIPAEMEACLGPKPTNVMNGRPQHTFPKMLIPRPKLFAAPAALRMDLNCHRPLQSVVSGTRNCYSSAFEGLQLSTASLCHACLEMGQRKHAPSPLGAAHWTADFCP